MEEQATVGLGGDTAVEDGDGAVVAGGADESANALSEFEDGFGKSVLHEGISAAGLNGLEAGFDEGMVGDGEGEAGDDDMAEGVALHVDTHPEAVEPEENGGVVCAELVEHLAGGCAGSLDEEAVAFGFKVMAKVVGDLAHEAGVGEEDEGAGAGLVDELADGGEGAFFVVGCGGGGEVGGQLKGHLLGVVKGGADLQGLAGFGADALEEVGEFAADGEGCAGEDDAGGGFEEGFAEDGADVDGSGEKGGKAAFALAF